VAKLGDYIREECNPLGSAGAQELQLIGVSNEHGLHASSRDTSADLSRYQRIEKNWFAYNPMRVNVGSIGLADEESKTGFTSPDYTVFSCRKGLDPHYLLHFLKSDYGLEAIVRNCSGAVRKRLYYSGLAEIELPVPSLEEQRAVVMRIHRICETIRFIREENSDNHELPQLKQAIRQEAIQGKLTADWRAAHTDVESASKLLQKIEKARSKWIADAKEKGDDEAKTIERKLAKLRASPATKPIEDLPSNWEWATVIEANLLIVDCHNKTAPYEPSGIPIIRTTNVRNGVLDLEETKYISEQTYQRWSARCIPLPGDLIFTREAPVGEVGQIPEGARVCLGQRTMLIRPMPQYVLPAYLLLAIQAPEFMKRASRVKRGAMVGHLRVGDVETAQIPLPPLAEQVAIVERVEALMKTCRALEVEIEHARSHAAQLFQAVLKKAFAS
jgi:type I restriction enzyme S subunit